MRTTYKSSFQVHLILILCLFFNALQLHANKDKFDDSEGYLILVHPTLNNIKCVNTLIKEHVFNMPTVQVLGLYHKQEQGSYKSVCKYIEEQKITNIELHEVDCEIDASTVYSNRSLRKELRNVIKKSYGILFFGGPDIPAELYNQPQSILSVVTDPYRHYFEIASLAQLLGTSRNKRIKPLLDSMPQLPIYAFCLGAQSMNVATGGSLIQDIPSEVYEVNTIEDILKQEQSNQHKNYAANKYANQNLFYHSIHPIKLLASPYWNLLQVSDFPHVLSAHHQAIDEIGQNIIPIATSLDGKIIEAIAHEQFPRVIGFQFHPERNYLYKSEVFSLYPDTEVNIHELLKEDDSLDFHLAIWKQFSIWVQEYRNRITFQ